MSGGKSGGVDRRVVGKCRLTHSISPSSPHPNPLPKGEGERRVRSNGGERRNANEPHLVLFPCNIEQKMKYVPQSVVFDLHSHGGFVVHDHIHRLADEDDIDARLGGRDILYIHGVHDVLYPLHEEISGSEIGIDGHLMRLEFFKKSARVFSCRLILVTLHVGIGREHAYHAIPTRFHRFKNVVEDVSYSERPVIDGDLGNIGRMALHLLYFLEHLGLTVPDIGEIVGFLVDQILEVRQIAHKKHLYPVFVRLAYDGELRKTDQMPVGLGPFHSHMPRHNGGGLCAELVQGQKYAGFRRGESEFFEKANIHRVIVVVMYAHKYYVHLMGKSKIYLEVCDSDSCFYGKFGILTRRIWMNVETRHGVSLQKSVIRNL